MLVRICFYLLCTYLVNMENNASAVINTITVQYQQCSIHTCIVFNISNGLVMYACTYMLLLITYRLGKHGKQRFRSYKHHNSILQFSDVIRKSLLK